MKVLEPCCMAKQLAEMFQLGGTHLAQSHSDWCLNELLSKSIARGDGARVTLAMTQLSTENVHLLRDMLMRGDIAHLTLLLPPQLSDIASLFLDGFSADSVSVGTAAVACGVYVRKGYLAVSGPINSAVSAFSNPLRVFTVTSDPALMEALESTIAVKVRLHRRRNRQ